MAESPGLIELESRYVCLSGRNAKQLLTTTPLNRYIKAALPPMKTYGAKPLVVDPNTAKLEGTQEPPRFTLCHYRVRVKETVTGLVPQ